MTRDEFTYAILTAPFSNEALRKHDAEQRQVIEQQAQDIKALERRVKALDETRARLRWYESYLVAVGPVQWAAAVKAETPVMHPTHETLAKLLDERLQQAQRIATLREALKELYALVQGECPRLLNEDSGGDARLAMQIEQALKEHS